MSVEDLEYVEKQVKEAIKQVDPSSSSVYMSLNSSSWSRDMVNNLIQVLEVEFILQIIQYEWPDVTSIYIIVGVCVCVRV